ncbi:hypothetical protein Poli38472_011908 [Pythium oligandrum]|uniref:tetraacyldisaccharide 4'-kinase n=1 Tax=Pythium oligandrum TaxID=41045 RepID=A0A8K1FCH3_PYTOL|nr:hypothetical protein Poli38472_011908 [Pythium oligandrum]|eukprot:TMW58320.1 hypothetical protein Poli38472_011908 [Pythium oligandrum]
MLRWERWRRRAHCVMLQRLRTPLSDAEELVGVSDMPLLSRVYAWVIGRKRAKELSAAKRISPTRIPVISVGNFTFGATGKTPCVMHLTELALRWDNERGDAKHGRVPMLLTRGYGDDEWRMFQARFPSCKLAVGADRVRVGVQGVATHGSSLSCVLLEDGLQQWKIQKDLEIVMVDALAPFGNGKLIPHGSLREPPRDALQRADVVIVHHANLIDATTRLPLLLSRLRGLTDPTRKAVVATSEMAVTALVTPQELASGSVPTAMSSPTLHLDGPKRDVVVFCGVGNPESVQRVVEAMNCWRHVHMESFPDHHAFSRTDLEDVRAISERFQAQEQATDLAKSPVMILTTEKDYARAPELIQDVFAAQELRILVCAFRLSLDSESEVHNRVKNLLR